METPAEVIWHNMDPIPRVAKRVDERIAWLEKFFDRIVRCRVVIEAAHQRHRKENQYEVRVEVGIPGGELSINRRPGDDHAHFDLRVTIRNAFDAMERQLRRWKGRTQRPAPHAGGATAGQGRRDQP